jgi:hypothetical protein
MDLNQSDARRTQDLSLARIAAERNRPSPAILYKYLSQSRIDVVEKLRIRFTQPVSFNDPFAAHPPARLILSDNKRLLSIEEAKQYRLTKEQWVMYEHAEVTGGYSSQHQTGDLGILSLSERCDHLLMWSPYADSHSGFVIGLDSHHPFLADGDPQVGLEEHPGLMLSQFSMEATGPSVQAVTYLKDRPPAFPAPTNSVSMVDCISKAKDWSYEQEWRAFRSLRHMRGDITTDNPFIPKPGFLPYRAGIKDPFGSEVVLFDLPPDAIKEIVIGLKMNRSSRLESSFPCDVAHGWASCTEQGRWEFSPELQAHGCCSPGKNLDPIKKFRGRPLGSLAARLTWLRCILC